MIVTPEHLMKQYFPEPVETTRDLYNRLDLNESEYSYLNWLQDAEKHCFSNFVNDIDYKLLPDSEKNYWISQGLFWTIIQTSPSKICDEIRSSLINISNKVATDRAFARQLLDQIDEEHGIKKIIPKVSKSLKSRYNETGQDALEFSVQSDTRLYLDIISGYNFQPGQKIKHVLLFFKLETENDIPFHIIDITLTLTNDDTLTYRTIWSCSRERLRYGAILGNRVIRVNLFQENNKLIDSYDYILGLSDLKVLERELEKVMGMLLKLNLEGTDLDQLGEKILYRYNLNEQAYALAIKEAISARPKTEAKESAESVDAAFMDAIDKYWDCYLLQPDPSKEFKDNQDEMVQDRIPRVTLALIAAKMLYYDNLCDKYFKRRYSNRQKRALLNDGNIRLIFALSTANFDPAADHDKRTADICSFIAEHFGLMQKVLTEAGQWPSN
ncbi:MAG TPA: hypothetical protein VHQ70_08195 [Syntrophomonadaceae bacterium]|nr:hypothetical protein [Syntrophomonadaceae bacterium]